MVGGCVCSDEFKASLQETAVVYVDKTIMEGGTHCCS